MTLLWHILVEPLSFAFMQRALAAAILIGALSAVLSCYLILKGWSLMGDAISHAVLPGIVLAHLAGLPLAFGAFLAGLGSALATGYLAANSRVKQDTVLGIVFSGMFAIGLVMFTKVETDQHLNHILFGNILGVSAAKLVELAVVATLTLAIVIAKRRDIMLVVFDPAHARAIGLPVRLIENGLLVLLALAIVASMTAVGILLVVAMLITPGATAYLLTHRFDRMLLYATAVAVGSCIAGTYLSFHIDGATAPCIVLVQAVVFLAAFLAAPGNGLLRRKLADVPPTP